MKLVIAGNYQQFLHYFPERGKDVKYISQVQDGYGHRGAHLVKVGTWYEKWSVEDVESLEIMVKP